MKALKRVSAVVLCFVMLFAFCTVAFAAGEITIDDVRFQKYVDSEGKVDNSLVTVVVKFTAPATSEQATILLTSENLTEISSATAAKVIYIDQDVITEESTYVFTAEKARIKSATGLNDINGCTLFLKMGADGVDTAASKTITFSEPTETYTPGDVDASGKVDSRDIILVRRYIAGGYGVTLVEAAADVDANGKIDSKDIILIRRYIAGGYNVELK